MSSFEQLKHTFFDECSDLLQQLDNGLTDIRESGASDDAVNAVFRAVHSIKGGAGIFGFDALVRFAHVFETVLDEIRSHRMDITPDNIDTLLTAGDVLSDLVAMSRAGETPTSEYGNECRTALEALMGNSEGAEGGAPGEDFADIEFTPVKFGDDEEDDGSQTYEISFRPRPELLKKANEPLFILRELRTLGELELTADASRLPPLGEMEFDHPYVAWTGKLKTTATQDAVTGVFDFVVDDCDLSIINVSPVKDTLPSDSFTPLPDAELPMVAAPEATIAVATPPGEVVVAKSAPATEAKAPPQKVAATTTRVELEKIDRVVNMVGELVIAQAMLGQIVQDLP